MTPISIVITDDHAMLRELLVSLFNSDNRFRIIGQCGSGEDAVKAVRTLKPDILILDINLPGMTGFETCKAVSSDPVSTCKILGVSMNSESVYASKMLQCGASGYVTKNSHANELFNAVVEIFKGNKYICQEIKDQLSVQMLEQETRPEQKKALTMTERELINFIRKGLTSKEIGLKLGLSMKAIQSRRYVLLKKLKLPNVAALVNYAGSYLN